MNFAFDLGHPGHFHLFRHLIRHLKANGHVVFIHVRDKDILTTLLTHEGWPFHLSNSKPGQGLLSTYIKHIRSYFHFIKGKKIDFHLGTSVAIGPASRMLGGVSHCWNEDDIRTVKMFRFAGYWPSHKIIKPSCLTFEVSRKTIFHPSYHELAYLHPAHFTPDAGIPAKYGLIPGTYVVRRLSALKAYHDKYAKGISTPLYEKMNALLSPYRVITSKENEHAQSIEPWDMHHVLAFAKCLICDSQTMTIEAAVLGVPAIRINTFIGKSVLIDELENKYRLCYGYFPHQETAILSALDKILNGTFVAEEHKKRRAILLSEKKDLAAWMNRFYDNPRHNEITER
jgi:predicted glycosyltransferase